LIINISAKFHVVLAVFRGYSINPKVCIEGIITVLLLKVPLTNLTTCAHY